MQLLPVTRHIALAIVASIGLGGQAKSALADDYYTDDYYADDDYYGDYGTYANDGDDYATDDYAADGLATDGIQVVVNVPQVVHVAAAPPEPYVEHIPVAPNANWVWVSGAWNWDGYQWTWVSGRWVHQRPGYVYVQPYYDVADSGCYYTSGYFVRAKRARYVRNYVRQYRTHTRDHRWNRPRPSYRADNNYVRQRPQRYTQSVAYREQSRPARWRSGQPAHYQPRYRSPAPNRRYDRPNRDHRAQRREWAQRDRGRRAGARSGRDHRRR